MPIPGWWNLHLWSLKITFPGLFTDHPPLTAQARARGVELWGAEGTRGVALPGGKVQEMDTLKPGPLDPPKKGPGKTFRAEPLENGPWIAGFLDVHVLDPIGSPGWSGSIVGAPTLALAAWNTKVVQWLCRAGKNLALTSHANWTPCESRQKKERGLSDHRCVVQQCGNPEPRPQWFNMTEPITNDIERWRTDANGRFCKQYSALFFFQHSKPINQSKNLQIKITRPINQVSLGPTKGAMTGVRDHHTTVGGWVFWLVRGPNSGASLQRTPTGTGLSSENSTGKAMGFWSFWSLSTCFKFLCGISMNFVLNHCGAIASRVMALPRQTGRLYDWFSEYRLRAAGREDILEKVGRLGGKDEWLEKTPVGWRLVRHFIGFYWLINKWIQVTSDHWILIHYHIGLYYPKHKWW